MAAVIAERQWVRFVNHRLTATERLYGIVTSEGDAFLTLEVIPQGYVEQIVIDVTIGEPETK